jgi:CPA2 family monovalent cation:H+ antiporter-2
MWDALAPLLSLLPSSWLPVVAAGTAPPVFEDIAVLGALSVGIAYLCYRLHLVPIAGFLIAGVVIGPHALGLVEDVELVNTLAEVGVILLLFTIGIEFSLDELSRIRRLLIGGGSLQVGGTIAVVTGLCLAFGVDVRSALFTGCLVALSSTAIVLGLLADRAETDTPHGQGALGILIFQDLAIIAMVLLMPLLGGQGGSTVDLLLALGKAIGLVVAVLLLARWAVPILLERVAATRRPELFLLTVVALCFGTAWVTSLAGVSLALGAFLAGLVVSESPYSTQALSEVLPLRTVFNAAFFVSVGMLLDLGVVVDILPLVLGGAVAVLLVKALVTTFSLLALRLPLRIATGTGLLLAQIGEFSFVLDIAGRQAGLTPAGLGETGQQAFIASTVLLMLLTPLLASAAPAFGRRLETAVRSLRRRVFGAPGSLAPAGDGAADPGGLPLGGDGAAEDDLSGHVVVVGYGPSGRRLTTVLQQANIPFVIVELNPRSVDEAREAGLRAVYGDATRPHVLEVAGIEHAHCLVVAINDREATVRTVQQAHRERPDLQILARADFLDDVERLHDAGAQIVIPPELETAVRFFSEVLTSYDVPADEVHRHVRHVRERDYEVMRRDCSAPAEEAWDVLLDAGAPGGGDRPA